MVFLCGTLELEVGFAVPELVWRFSEEVLHFYALAVRVVVVVVVVVRGEERLPKLFPLKLSLR